MPKDDRTLSVRRSEKKDRASGGLRHFAFFVAAGIFLSRVAGLIRDRVFAHYFGNSDAADAFKAALKIPNFLQNLFGEGVLSASFIPVYAGLLAQKNDEEARRTAGAVAALLALATALLVLIGMMATPCLVDILAWGFSGAKRELTIRLVRILFPGVGLLVFSAWCLGILNSHRRFFLSYTAPVVWNGAMIVTLLGFGSGRPQYPLSEILAWGAVVGSALQVGVQFPVVMKLLGGLRLSLAYRSQHVRTVVKNFVPVFFGRGVIQISAFVDGAIASLLPTGAVAALGYAQTLYTLPVSLFGMSMSAAELPLMSGAMGSDREVAEVLRTRLNSGLRHIAFFVLPSGVAFLALGDVIVGAIYQTGKFATGDVNYVWGILAGATVGLLSATFGRLYSSAFYALRDPRTPMRFALLRVATAMILGYLSAVVLPSVIGISPRWGVAGLTVSSGIASIMEFLLLRRGLTRRIGATGLPHGHMAKLWTAALAAAGIGFWLRRFLGNVHPLLLAMAVLPSFGVVYYFAAILLRIDEATSLAGRFLKVFPREKKAESSAP